MLNVRIDEAVLGRSAVEVVARLEQEDPPIYVLASRVSLGEFPINSCSLTAEQAEVVAGRLHTALT